MYQKKNTMGSCCFKPCGCQLNPLDVKNTLVAGTVCETCKSCGETCSEGQGCLLATAYFADQVYKAGYCPSEALCQGTLFPELVRPYMS